MKQSSQAALDGDVVALELDFALAIIRQTAFAEAGKVFAEELQVRNVEVQFGSC